MARPLLRRTQRSRDTTTGRVWTFGRLENEKAHSGLPDPAARVLEAVHELAEVSLTVAALAMEAARVLEAAPELVADPVLEVASSRIRTWPTLLQMRLLR